MKSKLLILFLIIVTVIVFFVLKDEFFLNLSQLDEEVGNLIKETEKKVFTPSPLIHIQEGPISHLDKDEIIRQTNIQREKYGVDPLRENNLLDLSAGVKAEDMFLNQYFEHESLSGKNVSDLANRAGYEFIVLGENLAMGNFKDEEALVQAWMDSPGHRENLLKTGFSEIGVAVLKGDFEGEEVWIAVQHFALPLDNCPKPTESIKALIAFNQRKIEDIEKTLNSMKDNLKTRKEINQYNSLVKEHNDLVEKNESLIEKYNNQINIFNECLKSSA